MLKEDERRERERKNQCLVGDRVVRLDTDRITLGVFDDRVERWFAPVSQQLVCSVISLVRDVRLKLECNSNVCWV